MLHSKGKKHIFFGWFHLTIIRFGTHMFWILYGSFQAMEKTLDVLYLALDFENKKIVWESAHPNGILLADGFRYLPDGFSCWMLLVGSVGNSILGWAHS